MPAFSYYDPPAQVDKFGLCGEGPNWQANVQTSPNPRFELLVTAEPGQPNHWPELDALVREVNESFQERASALIKRKREETGEPTLELTVFISPKGLMLVYALPTKGKQGRAAYPMATPTDAPRVA